MSTPPATARRNLSTKQWGAIALSALLVITLAVVGIAAATDNLFPSTSKGDSAAPPADLPDDAPAPTPTPTEPTEEPVEEPAEPLDPQDGPYAQAPRVAEDIDFWVDPDNQAARAVASSEPGEAAELRAISEVAQAVWVGDWIPANEISGYVAQRVAEANEANQSLILVVYAIPGRDCGNHSAGGVAESEYRDWIDAVADGLWQSDSWVVLEPDAIAQLGDCQGQGDRAELLRYGAQKLTEAGNRVFLDAGHSGWHSAAETASRLSQVGFEYAAGFSLNVSNYNSTAAETAYGNAVIDALGEHVHFVIDTARNGNGGVSGQWCNVAGQALGAPTQTVAPDGDNDSLQAYLWIKRPGESDGECNGGPAAGAWWQEGALALVRNGK